MKWDSIALGNIAVQRGGSVNPKKHKEELFELFSIPAFDSGEPEVTTGAKIGSSKKCVQPNDVLISRIVPHIRRAWVVGSEKGHRQIASGEWIVFRSKNIWPQYLRWVLVGDVFHSAFMRTVSGVGGSLLRARPAEVYKIEIPLPPIAEQKRIAAILDAADALRVKRRESLAQLETLLQSTFLDMFGDPVTNPMGWETCDLIDVTHKITDGTHKTPNYTESGIEFLSAKDLKDGEIRWNTGKFISEEEHQQLIKRCNPEPGDVLLAKSGSLGSVAIIDRDHEFSLFESLCLIKHDRKRIEASFLTSMIRTPVMQTHLLGKNKGVAIKHLHLIDISKLRILIPPLKEQRRFAAIAEAIEKQKARMRAHLAELDILFASLQSRAFNGEL